MNTQKTRAFALSILLNLTLVSQSAQAQTASPADDARIARLAGWQRFEER